MKKIKVMSEMAVENLKPEILFWVGCAGSYDARAQRVTKALSTILQNVGIDFLYWALKKVVPVIRLVEQVMNLFFR